mgnify:CR=1 FL=1
MFAQDAFVQVRLKERKRYAKDKAVHCEQLIFLFYKIVKKERGGLAYSFFFFFEPILFSV